MAASPQVSEPRPMVILSRPLAQCASLALRVDDTDAESIEQRLLAAWQRAWQRAGPRGERAPRDPPRIEMSVVEPQAVTREARERDALRLLDVEGNAFIGGRLMNHLRATLVRVDRSEHILLLVAPALVHAQVMLALGDELVSTPALASSTH
jgi:hypothetical protein